MKVSKSIKKDNDLTLLCDEILRRLLNNTKEISKYSSYLLEENPELIIGKELVIGEAKLTLLQFDYSKYPYTLRGYGHLCYELKWKSFSAKFCDILQSTNLFKNIKKMSIEITFNSKNGLPYSPYKMIEEGVRTSRFYGLYRDYINQLTVKQIGKYERLGRDDIFIIDQEKTQKKINEILNGRNVYQCDLETRATIDKLLGKTLYFNSKDFEHEKTI